jgi:hypothetical protein
VLLQIHGPGEGVARLRASDSFAPRTRRNPLIRPSATFSPKGEKEAA